MDNVNEDGEYYYIDIEDNLYGYVLGLDEAKEVDPDLFLYSAWPVDELVVAIASQLGTANFDTDSQEFKDLISKYRRSTNIVNSAGRVYKLTDFDRIVDSMDENIREDLEIGYWPCSGQELFDRYAEEYKKKYGRSWELAEAKPEQ